MYIIRENNKYVHIKGQGLIFRSKRKAAEFAKSYNKTFGRNAHPEKTTQEGGAVRQIEF